MLDQCLVIYETDKKNISLTSVLRCRKCKFYLNLESVSSHSKACNHGGSQPKARGAQEECTVCGTRGHNLTTHAGEPCLSALQTTLALRCRRNNNNNNSCLVCSKAVKGNFFCENHTLSSSPKFLKIGQCFAAIINAFTEDDSIEELIVASKQRSKKFYQ